MGERFPRSVKENYGRPVQGRSGEKPVLNAVSLRQCTVEGKVQTTNNLVGSENYGGCSGQELNFKGFVKQQELVTTCLIAHRQIVCTSTDKPDAGIA